MLITKQFLFFYSTSEIYSNWYPVKFRYDGLTFSNSEQAMMYAKAKLMGDTLSMAKIKKEPDPYRVKKLGRDICPWKESLWHSKRLEIVTDVCYAKFSSSEHLKNEILSTNELHLVEASSSDKIWGIGMDESDFGIENKKNWKGLNLLGEALMKVRAKIRQDS